ncbi:hypothetical protein [Rugosimonospora africana]|uniref:hypothetical protein n=1 Tax=Rugosimonospora africana TaxID=556532 RepID=UPI0019455444|nr:hypothetical protein [Rugosimonospora africana]
MNTTYLWVRVQPIVATAIGDGPGRQHAAPGSSSSARDGGAVRGASGFGSSLAMDDGGAAATVLR